MQQSFRLVLFGISVWVALAAAGPPAAAQTASLVYDFGSREPFAPPPVATPAGLFDPLPLGERLFFAADRSLWVTDGKPNGTRSLNDLCRGACPAGKRVGSLGSLAFFAAGDLTGPLWRSDGTAQGTFALTPPGWSVVVAGDPRFDPVLRGGTASLGGRFYFLACQGSGSPCGLWASDGTVAGTRPAAAGFGGGALLAAGGRLFGLDAGAVVVGDGTTASRIASLNGYVRLAQAGDHKIFLVANNGDKVDSLWVSDGTAAGTRFLRSFGQDPYTEGIRWLKVQGDRAYLVATDGRTELWRSDGTKAGTEQITAFQGDDPFFGSTPEQMAEIGGRAVFLASAPFLTGVWATTDGKAAPALLATLCSGDCPTISHRLVQVGNRVVFRTETGMMASDGTPPGTVPLPCRGECFSEALPFSGAALYLTAPFQLWQTDGTPPGTRRVADLSDAAAVPGPDFDLTAAPLGRRIALLVPGVASLGLWVTDGTKEGSFPLLAANEGPSADLENVFTAGDHLVFSDCTTPASGDLWASAGTAETTALLLHDENAAGCPTLLPNGGVPLGSATFFYRGPALWRTDGTPVGTRKLLDLTGSSTLGFSSFPMALGDRVVFAVADQNGNARLWESDGTPDGTRARFDFPAAVRRPYNFRSAGGILFFLAGQDIDSRVALWASDGSAAGTRVLTGLVDGNTLGQVWVAPLQGRVYFNFRTSSSQTSPLWRTDGTAAGTTRVTTPDGKGIAADFPVQLGGALYFFGAPDTPAGGQKSLWRFDGSGVETGPLVPLHPCALSPAGPTAAGSHLFFNADDGSNRCELWQSDGTAAGTVRVRATPPLLFPPDHLTAAGGRLFFVAEDGVHGRELWTSDGTDSGMVQDIRPGELPANPEQLVAAGGRLYFTADDGTTGRELWSLPLSGPTCQPAATVLCLAAGRFQLQVTWRDFSGHTGAGQAVPLSADTGTFWFFSPENVELIVKVLDAQAVNQSFWVFYGALSSVEYTLSVTDTQTGLTRRYLNPAGQLASFADTSAFGPLGAYSARDVRVPAPPPVPPALAALAARAAAAPSPCVAGADLLCLGGGRFAVGITWTAGTNAGTAVPVSLTGDTGYFWFFAPENVEVVVKVLDGRGLNGKFWVFYGALSNVQYTLTVTDTQTGAVKIYRNPAGQLASVADTGAF